MSFLTYFFTFSNATVEPPTSNQIRFDADIANGTSKLWVRNLTNDSIDVWRVLMAMPVGTMLYVQDKNDHTQITQFLQTGAPVDKVTYVELPVEWVHDSAPLSNNQQVMLLSVVPDAAAPGPPDGGGPPPFTAFTTAPWQQPQSVSSVLVSGPVDEPLTLAEGKLRAGLDWSAGDPRDDLMNSWIKAARSQVEQDTGLALLTQIRDVTFADDSSALYLPLPVQAWPVQSMITPDGRIVSAAMFRKNSTRRAVQWSTPTSMSGTWRIVSGWPTVDDLKAQAPLLVQAVGLLTAHYATFGRDTVSDARHLEAIPYGYDACIAPYQMVWIP